MEEVIYLQGEVICIKEVVFGLPDDFTSFFYVSGSPGQNDHTREFYILYSI